MVFGIDPSDNELVNRMRQLLQPLAPEPTSVAAELRPLPGIRSVLFDIYGTLLVSGSGDIGTVMASSPTAAALQAALGAAGCTGNLTGAGRRGVQLLADHIRRAHEERRSAGVEYPEVEIREIWTSVLADLLCEKLLADAAAPATVAYVAIEYECRVNPVWPMPGLRSLLGTLQDRRLVLGIVSNAQFYTPLLLGSFFAAPPEAAGFDPDLCAWSYRVLEAKPSANLFQPVMARLSSRHGIKPPETIYVGNDMLNDMWPAHALGMKTAFFAGDKRSYRARGDDPRCAGFRPDVVLTDLAQLLDVL